MRCASGISTCRCEGSQPSRSKDALTSQRHRSCWPTARMDESTTLRQFLWAQGGTWCDECLGRELDLPREDVKIAIFSAASTFARTQGYCTACGRPAAVSRVPRAA